MRKKTMKFDSWTSKFPKFSPAAPKKENLSYWSS